MKQDVARRKLLILLLELKDVKLKKYYIENKNNPNIIFESTCFRMIFGLFLLEMILHQD